MSKKSFKSFEDLECWKACTEVRRYITELVKKYPNREDRSYWLLVNRITNNEM